MKKFNFLETLLRKKFAMSGMSGMKGMNGLRVDAVNPDSQPTVNRQSRLTSVQRHDSVTNARVAREWLNSSTRFRVDFDSFTCRLRVCPLKLVSVLAILLTIGVGNAWGETLTCTFESVAGKTFPYNDAWTLTNGSENTTYHHGGSRCLQFSSTTAEIIRTTNKINGTITNVTFYAGRTSKNSTSTNVYIQTSTDGSTWTTRKTFDIATAGRLDNSNDNWTTVSQDLTEVSNCYVRISRGGSSTAVRAIDDIIITYTPSASCTTNPTVTAASNSSVTSTSATVSCSSGISSLGSAGCSISSYGFVIGGSANPAIGGSGVTKHEVGTSYTTTGTSFSKNLTGLSAEATYYVRPYATNGNGTAYGTQTSFTTPALPKYKVTYNAGTGTCGTASWTQPSYEASTTLPSATAPATCTGYSFAGWCTSSAGDAEDNTSSPGTILEAGDSYTPTDNITLYAVYTKTVSGGGSTTAHLTETEMRTNLNSSATAYGDAIETSYDDTSDGIVWSGHFSANSGGYWVQLRQNATPAYLKISASDNISQVKVTVTSTSNKSGGQYNMEEGYNAFGSSINLYLATANTVGTDNANVVATAATNTSDTYQTLTLTPSPATNDELYILSSGGCRVWLVDVTYSSSTTYYMTSLVCCNAPATALSITSASSVVTGGTVTFASTGGNGGTVTWSVTAGTGSASISAGVLTGGSVGTVTVKAHQDANGSYCAQDAEQAFTVVSSTVNVTGVEVSPTSKAIVPGETFDITPTISPSNATDKSVSWTSSASDKASVSSGTVTGVAAGTATITCTTTDGSYTATCAVTVRDVTLQARDEDGNTIAAGGPGAPSRSGATITAAANAGNYVFKQWNVENASVASTSTTPTTISNPTGAVTVTAVYYKPRVVKWSVNGNDSYNSGGPTTSVGYNGTISTVPTDPSGLVCAGTFIAWTDATHNNGQTAKDDDSYYGSALYTDAGDFPNITAATTTFYAVFAEGGGAAVNTVMWSEDWTGATTSDGSTGMDDAKPSAQGNHSGKTVYGGGSVTYEESSSATYVRNENTGGGTKPELMIKANESFTVSGISSGGASELTVSYKQNAKSLTVTASGSGYSGTSGAISTAGEKSFDVTVGSESTFTLTFAAGSNNVRLDDIVVKVKTVSYSGYVTECDENIVAVTYNANGGATSCANTTTDKTEDYTVCSTPPTRDYYTFAGWLCSADSKTYAASATISAAAIDADFTLTAQWTPVTYTITYNYNGGSAQVDPVPATSYTVESSDITLQTPTKGHDRFDGWYENADLSTGGVKTTIAAGSHEDKTYYAKWTARHEIIFDADGATTTIYRADDEDLSASVAEQGSVPSDPSAPTACSSKVFVGWSESTIDGETDTEPGDLMKPAAGTVDADKHYYAVWATESSESGTVYLYNGSFEQVTSGTEYENKGKWTTSKVYGTGTAGEVRMSSGSASGSMDLDLSDKTLATTITVTFKMKRYGTEAGTVTLSCMDDGSTASFGSSPFSYPSGDDNWHDYSSTVTSVNNAKTNSIHFTSTSGKRVYVKDVVVSQIGTVYSYSAYSTSCCATKIVLSDPSITDASSSGSTITFDKSSPVYTCGGTKTVTATVTVTAGYLVTELSFSGGSVNVSPAISTPLTSSQNYTLTFAEGTNATLTTTATVSAKPLNSITITPSSGEVYVGQYVDFTVSYDPADYINPGYTLNATPVYVTKESAAPANTKLRLKGGRGSGPGASITETVNETVTIKASGDNTKTASVEMTVKPLPRVHFVDLVHGKEFADVVATIAENALNANKTTKTSVDWATPNYNDCETNHLHLVGWIREDWPALETYLNGGDQPSTSAITTAGNDGSGNAYYFEAGAAINVLTFNGVTFYAVWAKVE